MPKATSTAVGGASSYVRSHASSRATTPTPGGENRSASGGSGSNFENFHLFHAQSPDTGRDVHARSWQANRGVDVTGAMSFPGGF